MNVRTFRLLGIWFLLFYGVLLALFIKLGEIKKNNFNQKSLDYLINSVSTYRDKTDDMCKYSLYGDPKNVGNNWIKLKFECGNDKQVISTLALVNIANYSFEEIINEYLRIINFEKNDWIEQNWKCFYDGKEVENQTLLKDEVTINCKMI